MTSLVTILNCWYENRLEIARITLQEAGVISQIQPYRKH